MSKRVSVLPVRQLAEKHGIKSAGELAKKAGLNPNTARRWWLDDATLTRYEADVIKSLAMLLECSPGDLFTFEDESA